MTMMQMIKDVGGKLVFTYFVKMLENAILMRGNILSGFKEIFVMNLGADIAGRGARYIQNKYSSST